MKPILKTILKYYLKYLTKLVLIIHRPTVIAVAGSINKPFVKKEIKRVLLDLGLHVRANPKNFNTEIGLPLAVLYLPSGYNSYKDWVHSIIQAPINVFKKNFPKYLVLGLGSSDSGDMKYLLSIIKPKIVVITDITQRYLEGFDGIDELFFEYAYLINSLDPEGLLIINRDLTKYDFLIKDCRSKIVSYGIEKQADYQALEIKKEVNGQLIKIKNEKNINEYKLMRHGRHHVYAFLIGLTIKDYAFRQIAKTEKRLDE